MVEKRQLDGYKNDYLLKVQIPKQDVNIKFTINYKT